MKKIKEATIDFLIYTEQVQKSQFIQDMLGDKNVIRVNNSDMMKGHYNLLVSIRDCRLFEKGMRVHRHWRLKDVKEYFGLQGGTKKVLKQLERLIDEMNALRELAK